MRHFQFLFCFYRLKCICINFPKREEFGLRMVCALPNASIIGDAAIIRSLISSTSVASWVAFEFFCLVDDINSGNLASTLLLSDASVKN